MIEDYQIVDVAYAKKLVLGLGAYKFCLEPTKVHAPLRVIEKFFVFRAWFLDSAQ